MARGRHSQTGAGDREALWAQRAGRYRASTEEHIGQYIMSCDVGRCGAARGPDPPLCLSGAANPAGSARPAHCMKRRPVPATQRLGWARRAFVRTENASRSDRRLHMAPHHPRQALASQRVLGLGFLPNRSDLLSQTWDAVSTAFWRAGGQSLDLPRMTAGQQCRMMLVASDGQIDGDLRQAFARVASPALHCRSASRPITGRPRICVDGVRRRRPER